MMSSPLKVAVAVATTEIGQLLSSDICEQRVRNDHPISLRKQNVNRMIKVEVNITINIPQR